MEQYFIIIIPVFVIVATILIVKWKNVKARFKEVYQEILERSAIVLLLLIATSCYSQKDVVDPKVSILVCDVIQVKNSEAILKTKAFNIKYTVDHKGFELGKEYRFVLLVHPSDNIRNKRAKVLDYTITANQALIDERELMAQYE